MKDAISFLHMQMKEMYNKVAQMSGSTLMFNNHRALLLLFLHFLSETESYRAWPSLRIVEINKHRIKYC